MQRNTPAGHELWKRDFAGATSLFGVVLNPVSKARIDAMLDGMRLFSVAASLIGASEQFFRRASTDVRSAMAAIRDASDVLALLLEGGHSTIAGRIAGAFRNAGNVLAKL